MTYISKAIKHYECVFQIDNELCLKCQHSVRMQTEKFDCKLRLNRGLLFKKKKSCIMLALTFSMKLVFVKGVVCKSDRNTCNRNTSNEREPANFCHRSNFCKLWHVLLEKWFSGWQDKPVLAVFSCVLLKKVQPLSGQGLRYQGIWSLRCSNM